MAEDLGSALIGAVPVIGDVYSAQSAKKEAQRNRDFQERMSNTAHQREVADLIAAGLNPALSAMRGGGASSPSGAVADVPDFGSGVGRGVSSALSVKRARAEIELLEAQADAARGQSIFSRTQAYDLSTTATDRYRKLSGEATIAELDADQKRALMPLLVDEARARIRQLGSSARQMEALALLSELDKTGRTNLAKFEEQVGSMGPAGRYILEILRSLK